VKIRRLFAVFLGGMMWTRVGVIVTEMYGMGDKRNSGG
jgi:hypothetical protein